jgi:tetratricopeptide (TPR) repeat protein
VEGRCRSRQRCSARDCLPADHPQRGALTATAHSRRGDALLLLGRAEDALAAFNAAFALTPDNAYIIYNRGCALLALDRREEAKAEFTTAAGPKYKRTGARKLAQEALAAMK